MTNLIKLRPAACPDEVLKAAIGCYDSVLILGWNKDDNLDARGTVDLTKAEANYLIDRFKFKLMDGDYDED